MSEARRRQVRHRNAGAISARTKTTVMTSPSEIHKQEIIHDGGGLKIVIPWSGSNYREAANITVASILRTMPEAKIVLHEYNQDYESFRLRETLGPVCGGKGVFTIHRITEEAERSGEAVLILSADSLLWRAWEPTKEGIDYMCYGGHCLNEGAKVFSDIADEIGFNKPPDIYADPFNIWTRISTGRYWQEYANAIARIQIQRGIEASSHHMAYGTVLFRRLFAAGKAEMMPDGQIRHAGSSDVVNVMKQHYNIIFGQEYEA
jgi:hypothetical protein